jgi:hypothetical protein
VSGWNGFVKISVALMADPSSLEKLHWIVAEQRRGPEAWRAAWLAAIDRAFPYNECDHEIARETKR